MITLLKIILFFILLSYLLRLLFPIFISFLVKRFQNKMNDKFNTMNDVNFKKENKRKHSKPKEKVGEYIDFEEIE